MENQRLVLHSNASLSTEKMQLKPSECTLTAELALTAENAKVSLSAELQSEWLREFQHQSPELLQRVFRAWRRRSPFMPTVAEIWNVFEEESLARYQEREAERWQQERADNERARAQWTTPEQVNWLRQLCDNLAQHMTMTAKIKPQPVAIDQQAKKLRGVS